jgi:signal peptidase I
MARTLARRTAGLATGLAVLAALAYGGLFAAGLRPVAIYSGSMEPRLPVGALAAVEPVAANDIRVGDVITFSDPKVRGRLVTHRVVEILQREDGRGLAVRTKGDANPTRDPWTIALPHGAGRVEHVVPWLGYAAVYAQTREVRTALVLALALLLLTALLRSIWLPAHAKPEAPTS